MFDNEVIGARYGVLFAVVGLVFGVLGPAALVASLLAFFRKQKGRGLRLLAAAPVLLILGFLMVQTGCVRRTVVVDLSSPQNAFRARTVVRNSGGAGSLVRMVEVATPGITGWNWTGVIATTLPGPIEIEWRDDATLVVRGRFEKPPTLTGVAGVRLSYEPCGPALGPAPALFVNHC